MAKETMTPEDRVKAAIQLEKPDRVPVVPLMCTPAAARLLELEPWKIVAGGFEAQLEAEMKVFDAFGGWDGTTPIIDPNMACLLGLKVKLPEEGEVEAQVLEAENWSVEEYDLIPDMGWLRFCGEVIAPRVSDKKPEDMPALQQRAVENAIKFCAQCRKRGIVPTYPMWTFHPFFSMSLTRSMVKFTEDLYYRPEKVERVLKVAIPEYIELLIGLSKATGVKVVNVTEERAGAFFYPLRTFERFWWPYTVQIVDALWSQGIVTWFHLDTSWDKNLPYFKQLPRGSAIIDLDGTTDIFAAKQLLRDHLCIVGDVGAALLCLGKPEEVEAYAKRLIDEVGHDGGLILGSACTLPGAVRAENFRAMIETGKTYELARQGGRRKKKRA
jgi:Uroporphyrinogen decarboxylase (URO-D)